jgi:hypothetical protein
MKSFIVTISLCLALLETAAEADLFTWVGGSGNDWKTAANWDADLSYPGELNNQDIAIVNLDGADVSLSGGLTYNPSSIQVTAPGSGSSALSITAGSVATTAISANQSVLVGGSTGSSTMTVGSGGSLTASTAAGKFLQIGDRNQNAAQSLLHIDGGTLSSSRVALWGMAGSELRVSDAAQITLGSIESDNNAGSRYGKVSLNGSEYTFNATSLDTGTSTTPARNFDLYFTADAGGIAPIHLSGNLLISNDDLTDQYTHLNVDLTAYSFSLGESFTLVNYGGTLGGDNGEFSTVTVNGLGGANYILDYGSGTDDSIVLTVIPEPGAFAMLLVTGLVTVLFRRSLASRLVVNQPCEGEKT